MSEIISELVDDVLVVRFTLQTIVLDRVIEEAGKELLELASRVEGDMLLDFRGVKHMSSAMIGKILLLQRTCKQAKIRLKVCSVDPQIEEAFTSTGISKTLSIYPTEAEAMAAFKKKRWFW